MLRNKLGIKSKREMDRAEYAALIKASSVLPGIFTKRQRIKARDICAIHKMWLGEIYDWAGNYRQVNVSKEGFQFAASAHVPALMSSFEKKILAKHTPCVFKRTDAIARAIAIVHVELVLIHPFREGNGRLARLVADLMAMQADLPPLDYSPLDKRKLEEYIGAIHAGLDKDYEPMSDLFMGVIGRTLKKT